jgi:hypothetical protein
MFSMKQLLPKAKRYFRENPGALFVIAFQILLLVCAGLLIGGNSVWANDLSVVAYFSLVIGVVLQLVSFLRHGKKEGECN